MKIFFINNFIDRLFELFEFEGVFELNNLLYKLEKIFENEILGFEFIVVDGGEGNRKFKFSKEIFIKLSFIIFYLLE